MRNKYSLLASLFIALAILAFRFSTIHYDRERPLEATSWDALGYYIYLPSIFIYDDYKKMDWLKEIDAKYSVTGGELYQARKEKNGNYVFKYLGGVAIMESPFFFMANLLATPLGYPDDGFSLPYQVAVSFGAILYCILALFLLRKILLRYFKDHVTALTLVLLVLASNLIEYIAIENGMSHGYIFPLYVLILYFTIKWHETPSKLWAFLIGSTIGLATISRPTEVIMLFIPLLWSTQTRKDSARKWQLVRIHRHHMIYLAAGGFLAVLPQLLYWKSASGSFIYDVGSKWDFLTPHIRVLFGFENGWFIYTPVALFFILGMFFIKKFPFKNAVITFCLLNIYIIIAWHDWRYGATYSCRALTQSYPVFALPFAAFLERVTSTKWKYAAYVAGLYLLFVNVFQIWQYNKTILHYRDMNRKYYCSIYLDPDPTPLDMSLLDTDEMLRNEKGYIKNIVYRSDTAVFLNIPGYSQRNILMARISSRGQDKGAGIDWLKIKANIDITGDAWWGSYINSELMTGDSIKHNRVRIDNAISRKGKDNEYEFYVKVPPYFGESRLRLYITSSSNFEGVMKKLTVDHLYK